MLRPVMAAIEGHRAEMDALAAAFGSDLENTGMENYLREITSLTQREGERTVYQTDEDSASSGVRSDTVLLNGSDRSQTGLVRQVNPPTYLGAVIVCQGADSASVRLAIVSAVGSVTGLSTDKITVLKMK